jgi:hypothetical protein
MGHGRGASRLKRDNFERHAQLRTQFLADELPVPVNGDLQWGNSAGIEAYRLRRLSPKADRRIASD